MYVKLIFLVIFGTTGVYDGRKTKGMALSRTHQLRPGFVRFTGLNCCFVLLQLKKDQSEPLFV
jgi:hypothetical protein